MKKRGFLTMLTLSVAMMTATTSCLKDGMNDFNALNNPWVLEGDFNPNLGMPVGRASMTIAELLTNFGSLGANVYVDPANDLVTLAYSGTGDYVWAFNTGKQRPGAKEPLELMDTTFRGSMAFDILDSISDATGAELEIANTFLTLRAGLGADCSEATEALVRQYQFDVELSDVVVTAVGRNGSASINLAPNGLDIYNFLNHDTVELLTNADISTLLNVIPTEISYSVHLTAKVDNSFIGVLVTQQDIADTLELNGLSFNVMFDAQFPLSVSLHGLTYEMDMPLSMGAALNTELGEITVDSSALILEFENALPIEFALSAALVDSITGQQTALIADGDMVLVGGQVVPGSAMGTYTVGEPSVSTVALVLTQEKLDALQRANKLHIKTSVATSSANGQHPIVSVRGADALGIKAYIQVHPHLRVSIPIL